MRLWQEIKAQLEEDGASSGGVIYVVTEKMGGYFENVRSLGEFSPSEICLLMKKGRLRIVGKGLRLEKYTESDVLVRGEIVSVSREEE